MLPKFLVVVVMGSVNGGLPIILRGKSSNTNPHNCFSEIVGNELNINLQDYYCVEQLHIKNDTVKRLFMYHNQDWHLAAEYK